MFVWPDIADAKNVARSNKDITVRHCHANAAQQQRFIDLYNEKKLPLEPMFGLYRRPYFAKTVTSPATTA
jgi:hypothetical protein